MKAKEDIQRSITSVAEKKQIRLVFVECEEPAESASDKAGSR